MSRLRAFRELFPALKNIVHVDVAASSLLSTRVDQAVAAQMNERVTGSVVKERWLDCQERVRCRFANLINAGPDEVAITKNVSEGINTVATAIDWLAGDSVIICSGFEHPNNIHLWLHLSRKSVKTLDIPIRSDYALPLEEIISAMRPNTRAVSVATVSFSPGIRADLCTLGRACRDRGILFIVDAAQSVGILHTDVRRDLVDILATSAQKGLTSLYGLGILYVRREWAERLIPASLARFGLDLGLAHEADYSAAAAKNLARGARRFEVGNPNFLGLAAVDAALEDLLTLGTRHIELHVLSLANTLVDGMMASGLPVINGGVAGDRTLSVSVIDIHSMLRPCMHGWMSEASGRRCDAGAFGSPYTATTIMRTSTRSYGIASTGG